MSSLINFIKGIFIGAGAILPGISSGVMCVIFGIYEDLLDKVLNFFKRPLENFKFLLPLCLGGFIGVVLVGKLLLYLFENFNMPTCFCFMGLILGCIPIILKQTNSQINKEKTHTFSSKFMHYLCLAFTLSASLYLIVLEGSLPESNVLTVENTSFLYLVLSGLLMSAGIVIPGLSSSVILMLLGTYSLYLQGVANINLIILFPMIIGVIIGGFFFLKLIDFLFRYFKSYTYYAIVGFTLGSVFVLYPGFEFNLYGVLSVFLFGASFIFALKLGNLK